MSLLDRFDFSNGDLPPWVGTTVSLTRPMATTLTAMIIPVGAAMCGAVAAFSAERAMAMATASTAFLAGIPEPLYYLVASIVLGYTAGKTAEVIKAPKPAGGHSPEAPPDHQPSVDADPVVDRAPRGRSHAL